jgi:hydroxymethylglutaryl-CoA reductase (NADPH)
MRSDVLYNLSTNKIKIYNIEKLSCFKSAVNYAECVDIRRDFYNREFDTDFDKLPLYNFNYKEILNKNCENVVGYIKIPVGIAGPIKINDNNHMIPLGTTEGALVGSINRGCNIINKCSNDGIETVVIDKGITRAPLIQVPSISYIPKIHKYIDNNFQEIKNIFESTTNYGKLNNISIHHNGTKCHMRFSATTGDAMGMNIITKGCEKVMDKILSKFKDVKLLSLSGNMCTDKKPSANNWIKGRSKTVILNTKLDIDKFKKYTKQDPEDLV